MVPRAEGGGIDIFSPLAAAGGWRLGWGRSSCPLSSPSVSFPSSAGGVALLRALSALTGLQVQAPMGLATGSFQNGESASVGRLLGNQVSRLLTSGCFISSSVLSCWSDGSVCFSASASAQPPAAPALQFVSAGVLQGWCWQAEWLEDALQELRGLLESRLKALSLQTRGRALGASQVCCDRNLPP